MFSITRIVLPGLAMVGFSGAAQALPPDQIFERVAPAVWSVRAFDAEERPLASASGVVIAPGKLLTSCHVLVRARQVQLRRGNTIYDAKLEAPDVERDLCQLDVPGLTAPVPALGSARAMRAGQRLYVVGFVRSNQQSIGEGLVSVLPDASDKARIHTTVAASPGLLGAGVFDEDARLVGVATVSPADAAANLFAVPAEWVPEAAARGKALLAAHAKPPAAPAAASAPAAVPGMPAEGTVWTYSFLERIWSRRQIEVTIRAVRVDGAVVEEAVSAAGKDLRRVVNSREARFVETVLSSSLSLVESVPYLVAGNGGKPPGAVPQIGGYPLGASGLPGWSTTAQIQGWEKVTVPAGTFKALRVQIAGKRSAPIGGRNSFAGRFEMTAWYAPEVKRIVRQEQRIWTADGVSPTLAADEVYELLAYRPPS